jgi:hypothetical protein
LVVIAGKLKRLNGLRQKGRKGQQKGRKGQQKGR